VGRNPAQGVPEELSGWCLVCGIDQRTVRRVGLIVNAIVLYNTIYTQRALHVSASASALTIDDPDIERLSPLGTDHITSPAATESRFWSRYATAAPTASSIRCPLSRLNPVLRTNSL
jgi:hypothetical protein